MEWSQVLFSGAQSKAIPTCLCENEFSFQDDLCFIFTEDVRACDQEDGFRFDFFEALALFDLWSSNLCFLGSFPSWVLKTYKTSAEVGHSQIKKGRYKRE